MSDGQKFEALLELLKTLGVAEGELEALRANDHLVDGLVVTVPHVDVAGLGVSVVTGNGFGVKATHNVNL